METRLTIPTTEFYIATQHKEALHMNMDTMGECIHYEFAENQPIDYTLYCSKGGLKRAYNDAIYKFQS